MALTHEDVVSILRIIDESPYDEVRLEIGDLKLYVSRHGTGSPSAAAQSRSPATAPAIEPPVKSETAARAAPADAAREQNREADSRIHERWIAVRAPMLGTFYRAPSPGEPAFVEIGHKVVADDTVCLVEVMKLFHSVKAGVAGTVVKIECENGTMVEHGQALLFINPD